MESDREGEMAKEREGEQRACTSCGSGDFGESRLLSRTLSLKSLLFIHTIPIACRDLPVLFKQEVWKYDSLSCQFSFA